MDDDDRALAQYLGTFRGDDEPGQRRNTYIVKIDEYEEYWSDVWQWNNCIVHIIDEASNAFVWVQVRFGTGEHQFMCPRRYLIAVID